MTKEQFKRAKDIPELTKERIEWLAKKRLQGKQWYANNKDKVIAANKKWKERNKWSIKQFRQDLRKEVIEAYGGKCVCCNEHRWQFLTLDHPNGGGQADRAQHRNKMGALYGWVKKNGFPKDLYRVLCMNCNWIRRFGGICPHQEEASGR